VGIESPHHSEDAFKPVDDDEDWSTATVEQPEPVDTTSTPRMWIGLVATTIVFLPLYHPLSPLLNVVAHWLHLRTFHERVVFDICRKLLSIACVFLIIWWDGAPLGVFGLKKPAWSVDTITACIVFAVDRTLGFIAVELFIDFLHDVSYKLPKSHPLFGISEPERSWSGALLLLILAITVSFSEELAIRGYFIPRLQRVLNSKSWAVVISAAFFGAMHLRQSVVAAWSAFCGGILYGIVFVCTRRLWPTVFAHAAYDFVAFLRSA
jgi:membrane protease YdiL (CAAX protease family)